MNLPGCGSENGHRHLANPVIILISDVHVAYTDSNEHYKGINRNTNVPEVSTATESGTFNAAEVASPPSPL